MLGGNLPGSRAAILNVAESYAAHGLKSLKMGTIRTSKPVSCVPGTPDFLDVAITGEWTGGAVELLKLGQQLEREAGRPALHRSDESRILDCDLIFFGDEIIDTPELTVPHPRACERLFVLEALNDLIPEHRFPDGRSVKEMLDALRAE